jgi:hypothetical protein
LPLTLRRLSVSLLTAESIASLPRELTHLALTDWSFDAPVDNLPPALTHLVINSPLFNQRLDRLPPGLEYLELGSHRFDPSTEALPPALKILRVFRRCTVLAHRPEIRFNEPGDWIPDLIDWHNANSRRNMERTTTRDTLAQTQGVRFRSNVSRVYVAFYLNKSNDHQKKKKKKKKV